MNEVNIASVVFDASVEIDTVTLSYVMQVDVNLNK